MPPSTDMILSMMPCEGGGKLGAVTGSPCGIHFSAGRPSSHAPKPFHDQMRAVYSRIRYSGTPGRLAGRVWFPFQAIKAGKRHGLRSFRCGTASINYLVLSRLYPNKLC